MINHREIQGHLRDLKREWDYVDGRGLDFEEWLTSQCMELSSTAKFWEDAHAKREANILELKEELGNHFNHLCEKQSELNEAIKERDAIRKALVTPVADMVTQLDKLREELTKAMELLEEASFSYSDENDNQAVRVKINTYLEQVKKA